jgi:hypothetical protein
MPRHVPDAGGIAQSGPRRGVDPAKLVDGGRAPVGDGVLGDDDPRRADGRSPCAVRAGRCAASPAHGGGLDAGGRRGAHVHLGEGRDVLRARGAQHPGARDDEGRGISGTLGSGGRVGWRSVPAPERPCGQALMAGASVAVRTTVGPREGITDAQGRVRFEGLAASQVQSVFVDNVRQGL